MKQFQQVNVAVKLPYDGECHYPVYIGVNIFEHLSERFKFEYFTNVIILSTSGVAQAWGAVLQSALNRESTIILVNDGEANKSVKEVERLWSLLLEHSCYRKSLIINLGGGVVSDLGGFVASTYMRGVKFLNIPTTLLSQVDASVGGKVGINYGGVKNLVGAFATPLGVVIDIATLKTLPRREYISGFSEVIKHGLIADKQYFHKISSLNLDDISEEAMIEIIKHSIEIKLDIVQKDPTEEGLRKVLNFGHTIGHALEALSQETKTPLLHGEGVSIGMVAEAKISFSLGLINQSDFETIEGTLKRMGLPIHISKSFPLSEMKKLIGSDKKNISGKTKWTLLQGIGKAVYDIEVDAKRVEEALIYIGAIA